MAEETPFRRFTNRLLSPGNATDETVRDNRQMADLILNRVSQPQPLQHPLQGAALLMQALNSQVLRQRADRGEKALKEQRAKELGDFLANLGVDPQQAELLRNAPESVRDNLMGQVAASRFEKPERGDAVNFADKDGNLVLSAFEGTDEFVRAVQDPNLFPTGPASQRTANDRVSGQSQREREIQAEAQRLQRMGVPNPMERATAVVDKNIVIQADPVTGVLREIDVGTGRSRLIDVDRGQQPTPPSIPKEQTLWELAPKATGIIPSAKAAGSRASGTFGGPISEETISARRVFSAAQNSVIRAFSLNPRYPVAEQQRILSNIQIDPAIFDSPELMRANMRGIDQFLRNELAQVEFIADQPGVSREQKSSEEQTARAIRSFLGQLGVPEEQSVDDDAPEGVDPGLWKFMTPEQKALWRN